MDSEATHGLDEARRSNGFEPRDDGRQLIRVDCIPEQESDLDRLEHRQVIPRITHRGGRRTRFPPTPELAADAERLVDSDTREVPEAAAADDARSETTELRLQLP